MPRIARQEAQHRVSYFRSGSLAGVEFARCEFRGPLAPTVLDHRWVFSVCDAGLEQVAWRGGTHLVSDGAVMTRRPGEVAAVRRRESPFIRQRMMFVEPERVQQVLDDREGACRLDPPPVIEPGRPAAVAFDALFSAATAGVTAVEQELLFAAFVETLVAAPSPPPPEVPPLVPRVALAREQRARAVELARRHLEDHFNEDVPLQQLASVAGVSKYHLIRLFRAELELPPHAYLLAIRVDRARGLILSGLPLIEVASKTGFADQSHFTRHFKRLVGIAPGAYARSG